ncbi:hypothetical protein AMATHDRAFT_140370 [Amanita thiersii Skay4041]|uniref:N-acetyltransferase domain-containing protein n=1 Tax=Amanita thiersii Skay4041 TaxID=703135 RepID=A0A2A9NSM3_9AGAR|nr:hypothetical protein AMATHDRAFT_140370 [Amanita thiersii Skay4041]
MYDHQFSPLRRNPSTGEPFLALRNNPNIIITPPRATDAPLFIPPMNDDAVHLWLPNVPYPYTLEHAETWLTKVKSQCDSILNLLESERANPNPVFTNGCPVRHLREIGDDGTETFIGDVGFFRCTHGEFMGPNGLDWDAKAAYEENNNQLSAGDPNILWSLGDYLVSSHHGRGIMTDAVNTLLHEWAIPRMNIRKLLVSAMKGNHGSVKVFLNNGFKLTRTIDEYKVVKGGLSGLHVLKWELEPSIGHGG